MANKCEDIIIPVIHEEGWNINLLLINESFYSKKKIRISVYDEVEQIDYTGVVGHIDHLNKNIRLDNVWILFKMIRKVQNIKS